MAEDQEEVVIEIDMVQLKKMKVQELRKQAAELGVETKGTKAEILSRIEKYLKEQDEELLEEEEEEEEEEREEGEEEEGEAVEEEKPAEVKEVPVPPEKATPPIPEPKADAVVPVKPVAVPVGGKELTDAEKITKRAARFGANSSEEAKKLARSQRFGTTLENGMGSRPLPTGEELEKMQKRKERFGVNVAPSLTQVEENERKQKRKERFGLGTTDLGLEERKKARLERFEANT